MALGVGLFEVCLYPLPLPFTSTASFGVQAGIAVDGRKPILLFRDAGAYHFELGLWGSVVADTCEEGALIMGGLREFCPRSGGLAVGRLLWLMA